MSEIVCPTAFGRVSYGGVADRRNQADRDVGVIGANDADEADHRGGKGAGAERGARHAVDPQLQGDQVRGLLADDHADLRVEVALAGEPEAGQVKAVPPGDDGRPDARRAVGAGAVGQRAAVGDPPAARVRGRGAGSPVVAGEATEADRDLLGQPDLDDLVASGQALQPDFPGAGLSRGGGDQLPFTVASKAPMIPIARARRARRRRRWWTCRRRLGTWRLRGTPGWI